MIKEEIQKLKKMADDNEPCTLKDVFEIMSSAYTALAENATLMKIPQEDRLKNLVKKLNAISTSYYAAQEFLINYITKNADKEILKNIYIGTLIQYSFNYYLFETNEIYLKEQDKPINIDALLPVVTAAFKEMENQGVIKKEKKPQKLIVKDAEDFKKTTDKINSNIWAKKDDITVEPITIPLKAERDGDKRTITNYVCLVIDELQDVIAIQNLTPYDRRVYEAISNLFLAGNKIMSIRKIFKTMGNRGNPAPNQKDKIMESIRKMTRIRVKIDTTEEHRAGYQYNTPEKIEDSLLHARFEEWLEPSGQKIDVVKVACLPIVFELAIMRNQYFTASTKALLSPLNKTDINVSIEDYILKRLHTSKSKKYETILLSTFYKNIDAVKKIQKSRARDTVKRLLDYYITINEIKKYEFTKSDNKSKAEDCIKIYF